jgi:uncharacterized membrane protein
MTVDAGMLLVAASILVWLMIVLPVVLLLVVAVWFVVRPKPSVDEIEERQQASAENAPSKADRPRPPTS